MKINELSKELNITNKELITFLKDNGFAVSSHNQTATDSMIDLAREKIIVEKEEIKDSKEDKIKISTPNKSVDSVIKPQKTFKPDDVIICRSVTPYRLIAVGVDKATVYNWSGYGDIDYLSYKDLQALRRTEYITKPLIVIEDADLCYQWRRELGDTYKYFLDVEYPEEFFDKTDAEFEKLLTDAPNVVKEVIKITAVNMIKNTNYPTLQKLGLIDSILGTCLKEFL